MTDMTNQIEEMLWRRLDGELTETETRQLMDALADTPEATRLESEVAELYQQLASVESEPPPAGLAERIHARIAERPARQVKAGGVVDWTGWFRRSVTSAPVLRYAAAAILLIVVIVGYQLSSGHQGAVGDNSQYTGTISAEQAAPAVQVDLGATRGDIVVSRDGDNVRLVVQLTSQEMTAVRVGGTGAGVRFVRSKNQLEGFGGLGGLESEPSVTWNLSGPGRFVLTVEPLEWNQRLTVGATVNGQIVASQEIELGDLPR